MHEAPTVLTLGRSVLISGSAVRPAAWAVMVAMGQRRLNGMPHSRDLEELGTALASALGHADVPARPDMTTCEQPDVSVEEAALTLGLSKRQTRRLATELGGKLIAGRWMLNRQAILERKDHRGTDHPI